MENLSPEAVNYPPHVIFHALFSFADPVINESISRPEFRILQDNAYKQLFAEVRAGTQTLHDGAIVTSFSIDQLNVFGTRATDFLGPATLALDGWLCDIGCSNAKLLDARLTIRQLDEEIEDITEIVTDQAQKFINLAAVCSMNNNIAKLIEA